MTIDELDTAKSFCEDGISHEVKGSCGQVSVTQKWARLRTCSPTITQEDIYK